MPVPFYKANFSLSLSALFLPALGLFQGNMGRPGIFIQATRLIQPHNILTHADNLKELLSFSDWYGGFCGVTQQHYIRTFCQVLPVLGCLTQGCGGWGLKEAGLICLWCSWKCF